MILLALVACFFLLGIAKPAHAMEFGIQDQGADPSTLITTAHQLGATTARIVVQPGQPHLDQVQAYRAAGLNTQAAITVKRWTTTQDILSLVAQWHGMVRTVSIGNEPELNGVPACTYSKLFRVASRMIRRRYPGIRMGFGEFSPAMAFEYIQKIARCKGARRIRADFTAVHPYQFFSDPLGAPSELSGVGTWLGLGNLGRFRRSLRRLGLPSRLRATEFSYLTSGPYRISMQKAAGLWPRALKQAAKWCDQLVIYGIGAVHDSPSQSWGSASLLDRYGRITVAYRSLAKALGRVLPPDPDVAPAPQGDLITPLPDLALGKKLTPTDEPSRANGSSVPDQSDTASGASLADPSPVEPDEPQNPPLVVPGPTVPAQDPTPVADDPVEEAPSTPDQPTGDPA